MSEKYDLETMVDAIDKLGKFIMINPNKIAGELVEEDICVIEPTGKNKHLNKVFVITTLDIDELPPLLKTLLTSHKPTDTMEE